MNPQELLTALDPHRGQSNGINARELARKVATTPRQVRRAVSALREQGKPICGTPRTGYYIATTAGELRQTLAFHKARLQHESRIVRQLEHLCTPELMGQLQL